MKSPQSLPIVFLLTLMVGIGACSKGQDAPEQAGSTIVTDTAKPQCGTPEFKDHPGCQLVNTRFSGYLKVGLLTLEGITKNTFDTNGRLTSQKTYSEEGSDNTILEVDTSFNNEGKKHIVTTKADLKPAGIGDQVIDTQLTETFEYNADGKPSKKTSISHDVPHMAGAPFLEGLGQFQYNSPVVWNYYEISRFSNNPATVGAHYEFHELNPDSYPERIDKLFITSALAPIGQERLEEHSYVYENGKPQSSVGKAFYCPSQPTSTTPPLPIGYCLVGVSANGTANLNDNRVPHGIQNVEWKYDDKGRVNRMEVQMDGDMWNHDPATNMGPTGGGLELEWWCDITYDDSFPEATLAAFPKDFEIFGLKETDKLQSIVCDDNKGLVSAELNFDGWAYLHEVSAEVQGPQ